MSNPHFLAIPYPLLGHMNPLMQFSQLLAKQGCKITFLTSEENYNKMKTTNTSEFMESQINLVSLPDGVGPKMDAAAMPWYFLGNAFFFLHMMQEMKKLNLGEWWLCNTSMDLEVGAISLSPKFLPIGPLIEESDHNMGTKLLQEDETCLEWLDLHKPKSVVYVSFGSVITIDDNQFKELALGLDLLNMPFIWVVREDNNNNDNNSNRVKIAYPNEFKGSRGKIVNWAPQKKILSHHAIACFVSHCGWNSTIEGVCNGVPFLCWPFFGDQLMNKTYICDVWKVGIGFDKDENGLLTRGEIKKKVEQLVEDEEVYERCFELMERVVKNKAQGDKNMTKFINWAKE